MTATGRTDATQPTQRGHFERHPDDPEVQPVRRAIADPGSVLPRHEFRRGEYETVPSWSARAVLATRGEAIDVAHLERQRAWSRETFGPGDRAKGVVDHIRKELAEIEADPGDLGEWVDVVILALDGAWRSGAEPEQIIAAIKAKQARNEAREWPDWRTAPADRAIEHVRQPYYVDRAGREHQR